LSAGIKQIGGLTVTPDGTTLYAGVTFSDRSKGIIKTSTAPSNGESSWSLVAKTENQPNGMAADWSEGFLYCTDEGTGSQNGGSVISVDINNGYINVLKTEINGADGCWFDEVSSLLFVGELTSLKVWLYKTDKKQDLGYFEGASKLKDSKSLHMLDDITLHMNGTSSIIGKSVFFGADFIGKQIVTFTLDGTTTTKFEIPKEIELMEPTSIRYGKGFGFCNTCLYVTEGGGITRQQTNRRVVQVSQL
jgi:sugar lactone lactonase YvrE